MPKAPIVIRERVVGVGPEIIAGGAVADRARLREAEEEVGEIVAGAADREPLGIVSRGRESRKRERAAAVRIGEDVVQEVREAGSETEIVVALTERQRVVQGEA